MDDKQHQAIIARDMIDMIKKYSDDADVLEYLEGFLSSLGHIFLDKDSILNWWDLAGVCDQRYYSLKKDDPIPLNEELLDDSYNSIKQYLPQ